MCFICLKLVCLISSCRYDQNLSGWNSTSHVIDTSFDLYMPLCSLHLEDESSVRQKKSSDLNKNGGQNKNMSEVSRHIVKKNTRNVHDGKFFCRSNQTVRLDPSPTAWTSRPASYVSMLCFTISITELLLAPVVFVCSVIISWAWL